LRRLIVEGRYSLSPESELLLIAAARAQLVRQVVLPCLAGGGVVVSDRYTPSTWAYQGAGRGLSDQQVAATVSVATGGLEPDLIVLLDVPPEVGLRRKAAMSGSARSLSRFEEEPLEFADRVRRSYLEQATAAPDRWLVLDAQLPARVLGERIWQACQPLPERARQRDIASPR
jgi:dTMP kinase